MQPIGGTMKNRVHILLLVAAVIAAALARASWDSGFHQWHP